MDTKAVRVLAVDDPAVRAYVKPELKVLNGWPDKAEFVIAPWHEYLPLMNGALTGRTGFDIVMVAGHLWKRDLVDERKLLTLGELDADILGAVVHECSHAGETYLSPSFCDGHMIVYDRKQAEDVFARFPAVAVTPAQYIEAAARLGTGSTAIKAHPSEVFTDALPFLRMYGGDVYDSEGNPTCDSEEVIHGLGEYLRLWQSASGAPERNGNDEVATALASGEATMGITWSGQLGAIANKVCGRMKRFGYRTLTTAWNVTWGFAVCTASSRPDRAKEFLAYLRSRKIDALAGEISGAPIRFSTYAEGRITHPWYTRQLEMIEKHARQLPDIRHGRQRNACLYEEIHRCTLGAQSARDAMRRAAKRIRNVGGIAIL